ncbi:MAG: SsrA-binding protein SmpB [Fimbriimonadaceae bacterium]|nr:SsrA-binding protein SmpB [Fimbriimonadaceae bacterium]
MAKTAPARAGDDSRLVVQRNRKAYHDYLIEDTLEAGLALTGTEVKSVRAGQVTLTGGFVVIEEGQAWLRDVYIAPYEQGNLMNVEPLRRRKLLLHRSEINRLARRTHEAGWTLVPLQVHFRRGRAKLEIGIARGKRSYDKRESLRNREAERDKARALAARRRED